MSFPVSGNHVDYLFKRIDAFLTSRKNDVALLYTATGEIDYDALRDIEDLSKALVALETVYERLEKNLTLTLQYCDVCSKSFRDFVSHVNDLMEDS